MSTILPVAILIVAVVFIVVSTSRWKMHPFLALLLASTGVGLLGGLSGELVLETIVKGFGGTMGSIGIIIACGTIIGVLLERSAGTQVIAKLMISLVGKARSALGMCITGAVVSVPVFCDSGFVVLSPLNKVLAREGKHSFATLTVCLSMGLYTTHVFVPPTPGPIAAAGTLGADIGTVILLGLLVSIPVLLITYFYASIIGRNVTLGPETGSKQEGDTNDAKVDDAAPSAMMAILPILLPVALISLKSITTIVSGSTSDGAIKATIFFIGNPNVALVLGVFLAFLTLGKSSHLKGKSSALVKSGLSRAGEIILITGAGGALGSILRVTEVGQHLGESLAQLNIGIFLPFVIAAVIKTAQGSSTVAIITTASIIYPMLESLGLHSGLGPSLVVLAIGAGSMTVSHANDSYFWIVSQLSGMRVTEAYKLQTLSSAVAGTAGILSVFILSLLLG
ncbi:MAG: GntP family permease [Puniceicoccaceae bacterium]